MASTDWKHSGLKDLCDTSSTWLQSLLIECLQDSKVFMNTFMKQTYDKPWTEGRCKNIETLDDDTISKGYVCAYRSMGKTTQLEGWLVKQFVFRLQPFVLFAGRTIDYAAGRTDNVKTELLTNPDLREVFGQLKARPYKGINPVFSKLAWFLSDPITDEPYAFCSPKGAMQQVNGAVVRIGRKQYRPTFIAIDDGEHREEILSEQNREKYKSWFYGALLPCTSEERPNAKTNRWHKPKNQLLWRPPWRVWNQDTIKHEAGNMAAIIQSSDWVGNVLPMAEKRGSEYYSLVPELVSNAQVRAEQRQSVEDRQADLFAMEKLCLPQATDDGGGWTRELFKYYGEGDLDLNSLPHEDKVIIIDPAKTAKMNSAHTAMLAMASDCEKRRCYFRTCLARTLMAEDIPKEAIKLALRMNTKYIAVEITGLEEHVKWLFENEVTRQGFGEYFQFIWLDARGAPKGDYGTGRDAAKRARGSFLLPMYQAGDIYHEHGMKNGPLEQQQMSFPKCARWDALDCGGYVPQILKLGGRYWQPKVENNPWKKPSALREDDRNRDVWSDRIRDGDWRLSYL